MRGVSVEAPSVAGSPDSPGVSTFYRQVAAAAAVWLTPSRRWQIAVALEAAMIAAFFAIRLLDLSDRWLSAWTIALGALALASPASGLTVLLATAPFPDWFRLDRDVGVKVVLIALLGAGVLLHEAVASVSRPDRIVKVAIVAWAGLALTLIHAIVRFDHALAFDEVLRFLGGLGGALIVFLVAVWSGRRGNLRPLAVAIGATALAAGISVVDLVHAEWIRHGPFDWAVRDAPSVDRVTGIINGVNAVATLCTAALAVPLAVLVLARDRRRLALLVPLAILLVAALLTFSRSGILALFLLVVLLLAQWRPRAAIGTLVVGLVVFVVLMPVYLQFRAATLGAGANLDLGSLITGDEKRWTAWVTGLRIWATAPFTGWGFQSFLQLRLDYGVTVVSHPHNELIRLLVDGGIGLAAAFVALGVLVVRRLIVRPTPLRVGAVGALLALTVGSMFNNPLQFVQVTSVGFAIVGIVVGWALFEDSREQVPAVASAP